MSRVGRVLLWIAVACVAVGCSGSSGGAASSCVVSDVWVFDSSFSDTGNAAAVTFGLAVPDPPYFDGRFSNGPVAVEHIAAALGASVVASADGGTNYALGGARTAQPNFLVVPPISNQVASYLAERAPDPEALYVMRVAANDLLLAANGVPGIDLGASVTELARMVDDLVAGGARRFLFLDLPDLPAFPPSAEARARDFNAALRAYVEGLPRSIDARLVSVFDLVEEMKAAPEGFGLVNVTDACLEVDPPQGCDDGRIDAVADGYLMYDEAHLTTRMHRVIADAALAELGGC